MGEVLSERERELIEKYGTFYRALNGGHRKPETPEQERFVQVCRGQLPPESEHEIAFTKYVRIELARREADHARQKEAEAARNATTIEDAPGQHSYPSRLGPAFDKANGRPPRS